MGKWAGRFAMDASPKNFTNRSEAQRVADQVSKDPANVRNGYVGKVKSDGDTDWNVAVVDEDTGRLIKWVM
jgi:hypothetical protein